MAASGPGQHLSSQQTSPPIEGSQDGSSSIRELGPGPLPIRALRPSLKQPQLPRLKCSGQALGFEMESVFGYPTIPPPPPGQTVLIGEGKVLQRKSGA